MDYPFNNHKLPLAERIKDLILRLTLEEKAGFFPAQNNPVERLGIPAFSFGAEGAHGFVDREGNNTTFPQTIGLAASWDPELLKKIGTISAIEARCFFKKEINNGAKNPSGLAVWSPTVDLERDPRWGRNEEGYGEDPFLTSILSAEYIKGAQGDDPFYLRVSCGPKHFFANNNEKDRASCSCSIPPRLIHEYYLVPFKNAIQNAKAASLMTAYNEVNGIPMMLHPILNSIVKKEWKLEGNIVTDGGDFLQTVSAHHYYETHKETLTAALKNGADTMTDSPEETIKTVIEAVEQKLISETELDKHLERILAIRFRLGLFDPPGLCPYDSIEIESDFMKKEYIETAKEAVKKSAVLLKNENSILPLNPQFLKSPIAVMGPLADELHLDWYAGRPTYGATPLESLKNTYGKLITYTDCRDIVSFTTDDGKPMVLIDAEDSKGKVKKTLAAGNPDEKPARFYMEDWGWGTKTFTHVESGLMLQGCYARREITKPQPQPIPANQNPSSVFDESAATITATAKNNLSWFGLTLFNIVPQPNGNVLIKTHDNRRVFARETGKPAGQHDDPLPVKGELFKIKLEKCGIEAAAEAASKAGIVIFFAGNDPMVNGRECVDRPSLNLPPRQEKLINKITEANPYTVLFLLSGYPFTCSEIAKKVPAVIWMAHGIQETGTGVADIISGVYSPAGRLPQTWYEDEAQLPPSIMEYDITKGLTYQYFTGSVLWPFGHGLSYSNFKYSDIYIDKQSAGKDDTVTISFKIKNTGNIPAEDVPQMYASICGSAFSRPLKSLKGFKRIMLAAGEEKEINFTLPVHELAVWDNYKNCFFTESCYCKVLIGASSLDIRLSCGFYVNGENVLPRKITGAIYAQSFDNYDGCYLHEKRGSDIPALFNKEDGAWLHFSSLDFAEGYSGISAVVQGSHNCFIEIRLDSPDGLLAGTIEIPNTKDVSFYPLEETSYRRLPSWGYAETSIGYAKGERITGVHDLFLVFYGKSGLWSFELK